MAKVAKTIKVCDRCGFGREKPATEKRIFSPELGTNDEVCYELDLCQAHAEMYDREMGGWTRLAREIDRPAQGRVHSEFFSEERKREGRRIAELRSKLAEEAASREFAQRRREELDMQEAMAAESRARQAIPGAMKWRMTNHAYERMNERGFTIEEVLRAAAQPETTLRQEWRGPHIVVHKRGVCRVVVDDVTKAIITVVDRSDTLETESTAPRRGALAKVVSQ